MKPEWCSSAGVLLHLSRLYRFRMSKASNCWTASRWFHLLQSTWCTEPWKPNSWMFTHNSGWRLLTAVACLRQLRAGILPRKPRFDSSPVLVRFVVHKVALGQDAIRELTPCCYTGTHSVLLSGNSLPCSHHQNITPPVLHAHFHLKATLTRNTKPRILGTFKWGTDIRLDGWWIYCQELQLKAQTVGIVTGH